VLSLGVDYSVFLVDAGEGLELDSQRGLGATLTGLLVSWVSNLCGFGLLAMSQQPALRLIGLIAGIGVTCALIFAPTALVLAHNGASPLPHSQRTRKSS
jgi:predicted exporter